MRLVILTPLLTLLASGPARAQHAAPTRYPWESAERRLYAEPCFAVTWAAAQNFIVGASLGLEDPSARVIAFACRVGDDLQIDDLEPDGRHFRAAIRVPCEDAACRLGPAARAAIAEHIAPRHVAPVSQEPEPTTTETPVSGSPIERLVARAQHAVEADPLAASGAAAVAMLVVLIVLAFLAAMLQGLVDVALSILRTLSEIVAKHRLISHANRAARHRLLGGK